MSSVVILYDILVTGIELPAAIVTAINRKIEQYYIAEEYKFRIEREKRESERKKIEAQGIRDFQQTVSQGISDSYLRWRGIEATLQLSQSTNSKVVIIGNSRDGLPLILGNVDGQLPSAGTTAPNDHDSTSKERTTASAAGLPTPNEKIPDSGSPTTVAAAPDQSRSFWPLTLYDIEAFFARMVRPTGPQSAAADQR